VNTGAASVIVLTPPLFADMADHCACSGADRRANECSTTAADDKTEYAAGNGSTQSISANRPGGSVESGR